MNIKVNSPPILQLNRQHKAINEKFKETRHACECEKVNNLRSGGSCSYYCTNEIISIYNSNKNNDDILHASANQTHTDSNCDFLYENFVNNCKPIQLKVKPSKNLYGKLRKTISLDNTLPVVENIYENLCENRCDLLLENSLCKLCEKNRRSSTQKRVGLIRGFLGNFKRKSSLPSQKVNPKRLEIIHNVQGSEGVFKTQDSFDLQKICQMRDDELLLRSPNVHHSSSLTDTYRKFQVYEDENIYENLDFNKSTFNLSEVPCVNSEKFEIPLSCHFWKKIIRTETHDYKEDHFFYLKNIPSIHQSFVYDESIIFLRNDKYTSHNLVDESYTKHMQPRNSRDLIENKRRCVYLPDETISNNSWKPTEISIILRNTSSSHEQESSDFVEGLLKLFDEYLAKSYANDKQQYFVQPCDQNFNTKDSTINTNTTSQFDIVAFNDVIPDVVDSKAVYESTQLITLPLFTTKIPTTTTPISLNTERKTNICLSVHHLSVSLNTVILCYCLNDKKIKYLISKLLSSSTIFFQDTIQRTTQKLSMRHTTTDSPPLGTLKYCGTSNKVKINLTDFLKQQSCESSEKSSIYDFIVKTTTKYHLDAKINRKVIRDCEKKFNDFIMKPHNNDNASALKDLKNYFKTSENLEVEEEEAIDVKLDHKIVKIEAENKPEPTAKEKQGENIYQPIWKCQTDGIGNDKLVEADEENIYETIKMGPIVDEQEWIVAEEFAFGSRISEDVTASTVDESVDPSKIVQKISPYTIVCVLLHPTDAKQNQIIHDYKRDEPLLQNQQQLESKVNKTVEITDKNCNASNLNNICEDTSIEFDSVKEWKNTLISPFYCEDEEDVVSFKATAVFYYPNYVASTYIYKYNYFFYIFIR
jgi:hypothetical protein